MKANILVIEDDKAVRNLITITLATFGYDYAYAVDGAAGIREAVSMQPDLFILDLGLPDMDGTEFIRHVRGWSDSPIIIVSARSEIADKIEALDAGADDYLTKPFSVDELLARIRVALRRAGNSAITPSTMFQNGALRIDYAGRRVTVNDREIHLTPIEYKLLCLMARNVGKVLTHNYILKEVWDSSLSNDTQLLRVFMATLRKKIEKDTAAPPQIQTHVGIGYQMVRTDKEDS